MEITFLFAMRRTIERPKTKRRFGELTISTTKGKRKRGPN
jgi:hypothetical protein